MSQSNVSATVTEEHIKCWGNINTQASNFYRAMEQAGRFREAKKGGAITSNISR